MPATTEKPPKSRKSPIGSSAEQKAKAYPNLRPFQPGQSGNPAGRPQGDGLVRKLILEALKKNRAEALRALEIRLRSPKTVQDVLELLARLEGELAKDSAGTGAISVIILRGERAVDPAEFRRNADARMALEARATAVEEDEG